MESLNEIGIVGLDLSLTGTGYSRVVGADRRVRLITTSPKDGSVIKRAIAIARLIKDLSHPFDLFLIEDYAFNVKAKSSSLVTLGELGGVVKAILFVYSGMDPLTVSSTSLKKWLGSGSMKKDLMPVAVHTKLGVTEHFKSHDEYVALALSMLGRQLLGLDECKTKYEQEVVSSIRKNNPQLQTFALKKSQTKKIT